VQQKSSWLRWDVQQKSSGLRWDVQQKSSGLCWDVQQKSSGLRWDVQLHHLPRMCRRLQTVGLWIFPGRNRAFDKSRDCSTLQEDSSPL